MWKKISYIMMVPFLLSILGILSDVFLGTGFNKFFVNYYYITLPVYLGSMALWFIGMTINIIIKINKGTVENADYVFLFIWVIIIMFFLMEWPYLFGLE